MKKTSNPVFQLDPKDQVTKPKHLRSSRKGLLVKVLVVGLVLSGVAAVPQLDNVANDARANGSSDKVGLYLSAPMVQGTSVAGASLENFNSSTLGACPTSVAGVSAMTFRNGGVLKTSSSDVELICKVESWTAATGNRSTGSGQIYGGAAVDTATPSFGGTGTKFMQVPFYNSGGERSVTFELPAAAKYVGFWWSGGNAGNLVRFYSGSTLLATVDSADITNKLGSPFSGLVKSLGETSYVKDRYYGNPVYYTDLNTKPADTQFASHANAFIFTYLNLYVEGSLNITKVEFAGPGFEFDNLAFSTVQQTPEDSMVKVLEIVSSGGTTTKTLQKDPANLQWSPGTTFVRADNPTTATVSQRASNSGATISYSVTDAGTAGCSFDATSFVISYSSDGNCVITASSAATDFYVADSVAKTFVISATSSSPGGSGSSSSIQAPIASADPCKLQSSAVGQTTTRTKTFSGFAINSSVLTAEMKSSIRTWLNKHPEKVCVGVSGFTMGPRVLSTDPKLAKDRARSVITYIKSLRPEASYTKIKSRTQKLVGAEVRRAKVTLRF